MTRDATSRMPFVTNREQLPEAQRRNYDRIAESRERVGGPFGVLLNSPEVAGRTGHLGAYLRFEGELSGAVRELAILTTAREFDCAYEWAFHEPLARREGVSEETVAVVADQAPADGLPEVEARVVRYGRHLLREHRVPDALFRAVKDDFGVRGITELTATVGYYGMLACVLNAFEVLPEEMPDFA